MSAVETDLKKTDLTHLKTPNDILKRQLLRFISTPGTITTAIDGFKITRFNHAHKSDCCFYTPAIAVVVQGQKQTLLGENRLNYGEYQCVFNGVDMPGESRVTSASPQEPFLAVSLAINRELITELCTETVNVSGNDDGDCAGVAVSWTQPEVIDAFSRLVDLLDTPQYIPTLAPLIIREIHYYILAGPQGNALRAVSTLGTQGHQIAQAISWLRENYAQSIHMDTLAKKVNMASTTFHRHFKQVTSLTPLQFQKRLRLYEAQRIMLTEGKDANSASFAVGYESPFQFNRDYKKTFGEPPLRNVNRLRTEQL